MRDAMKSPYYIRHPDGRIEHVPDTLAWARWFFEQDETRTIDHTAVTDDLEVSTVFLGIDHNFGFGYVPRAHEPVLFETMIFRRCEPKELFGGTIDRESGECWRWRTEAEARRAHAFIVSRLREDPKADLDGYEPLEAS